MAEWLSRWTSDLLGSLCAGSNSRHRQFFFVFGFFFCDLNDDGGVSRSDASQRKAQALMHMQRGSEATENASAKRKARGSEATESTCRNERSECRR